MLSHPLVSIALIIIGIFVLIKSADFLVNGASSLAKKRGISDLAIGLTIVAFGSSLPELFITIFSSATGYGEIAYGTIIGSNIFNTLFVLGIAGFIFPLNCKKPTVWREIPISFAAVVILYIFINFGLGMGPEDSIGTIDGLILLAMFGAFIWYTSKNISKETDVTKGVEPVTEYESSKSIMYIAIGIVGLGIGGYLCQVHAVKVAAAANLSNEFIGLTMLAFGTSLPELAATAVAAFKRKADMAMGSVVGSNIFNFLFILPIGALIRPIHFYDKLNLELYVLMGGTLFLFISMFTGKKKRLDRWEAFLLLAGFFVYLIYIIFRDTTPSYTA